MSGIALKRVADIIAGQSPSSDDVHPLGSDAVPFLQGNAEFGGVSPTPKFACATASKRAASGDILLSVRAPVGALNIADREYGIGRGLCAIRARPESDQRFIWWALHASLPELSSVAVGSTYTAVTADNVGSLQLPAMPLAEQRAIADYLDAETSRIDALITKKQQLISLLGERVRAFASHLATGQGGTKATFIPTMPVVPSAWKVCRNKTFMREVNERTATGDEEMLSVSHLTGVTPRSQKTVYMFEAESTVGYKLVRPGDLVINTMWAWMGAAGVAFEPGIVSPAYGVYRIDQTIADPRWIDLIIRTEPYIVEMTRFSRGVTSSRLRLYPDEFLSLSIPLPSRAQQDELVNKFSAFCAAAGDASRALTEQVKLLTERRQALITDAVTNGI